MDKVWSKYSYPDFRFALFRLGTHEFCIDIKSVREMLRHRGLVAVDGSPQFVEGFVELRGMSVPVVDLRRRFAVDDGLTDSVRIVIVSLEGRIIGFVVDAVMGIVMGCKAVRIKKRPAASEPWEYCVEAVVETDGRSIYVMNALKLLTAGELKALDSPIGPE